ncbi:recombinase family protein [Nonomuraea phyllanthi]|uniref:recombinase family protein n=1 Tax=Nonomuraea phyllanthi TaxID=2219224 RepID=UPI001D0278AF|nr:recombinase family protein [Nonomuraea phyllanthi]
MPRLKKALRVPTPADCRPGQPLRPGTPPPAPIDSDLPSADIRVGYARCSTLGQELDSQLDALSKHRISRDKIFNEKISTRVRVRPEFEEALRTVREVKVRAPHCRVIFTVYEMKRLGRDAAELTALADHLTAHGLVLEMLAGPADRHLRPHRARQAAVRVVRRDGRDRAEEHPRVHARRNRHRGP